MSDDDQLPPELAPPCECTTTPFHRLVTLKELGMDTNYAQVSLMMCLDCGRMWLRYLYELEAFTASGRWYLGEIEIEQAEELSAEHAKAMLESLSWYYYGGSYFDGKSGKSSGIIYLNP